MGTVADMHEKFKWVNQNLSQLAMSVIEGSDDHLSKYVQAQLMKGVDADGNQLRPYRDPEYAEFKRSLNPLGVTDLRLTGSFYEYMTLQIINQSSFTLISRDVKYKDLMKKYGLRTMDLGQQSIALFKEERFKPFLMRLIGSYTGVGIN